ncbi:phytanoyl-CoA dioxygenase [Frankia sp. CcI49]|uniref:phytanoyl-CoA dioxygenase family protein n=1 Tax=unclassified Frankia TaxID=2632575 RepID=UPI0006CA2F53|nr:MULTISPECIES: phytanoyl-CoA dioxygenase family protein [unclassified Frankia]KPM53749.1 phytanoyl-CoA dioxygenase [Frankia sp. R43]ONH60544.1 phytanoyl-CoA dioxygenase [Frankia sp. CcI49]
MVTAAPTLAEEEIQSFVDDGFVRVPEAFPRTSADEGRSMLWRMTGLDPDDPATWTSPVIRLGGSAEAPFHEAANTTRLRGAYDQLVGPGRWLPRTGLGTFPIRFPHPDDPGDAGWHMDGGYLPHGATWPWLNIRSRGRALLMLFLFSDVGPDDAPTRIKAGSHLDVPPFLAPAGDQGRDGLELCREMDAAGRLDSPDRPTALATGQAGDVYLCHPFLIHAAQRHRGAVPRFLAQPPLDPAGLLDLDRADGAYSPVELAVRRGLGTGV